MENQTDIEELNSTWLELEAVRTFSKPDEFKAKKSLVCLITYLCISFASVVVNLRVICIINEWPKRRLRPASVLIGHVSIIAIASSFFFTVYLAEKVNAMSVHGTGSCRFLAFSRNLLFYIFPLNVVGVIYERISTFRESIGELLVFRLIGLIWTAAIIVSLPTIFTVEYQISPQTNFGKCKGVPLMGSVEANLLYEMIRFLLTNVGVIAYMFYAVISIRSKIRFLDILRPISCGRLQGTIRKMRFIYTYSIFFVVVWLPSGVITLFYKVLTRAGIHFSFFQSLIIMMLTVNYAYLTLSPLLFLHLNDDVSKVFSFTSTCFWKRRGGAVIADTNAITATGDDNAGNDAAENCV